MDRASPDDAEQQMGPADVKRTLGDALGTTDMVLNYYELAPGESLGFGYHRHNDQEEVFYVTAGGVTFETEDGDAVVEAGEAVRFAPGEWQLGTNDGEDRAVVLAMGAPADMGETTMLRECPDCEGRTEQELSMADDRGAILARCADCGTETGRFD